MSNYTATYSPDDNKLRLYALRRLDAETYADVKAAGFRWAPKQELFFATWSPRAEDVVLSLAGEITDEDTTLTERAEERADRFSDYSDHRTTEANQARAAVDSISERFAMGQPILVGHHSERRARKDAEKIENGMRRAVKLWEISQYWQDRAAGAIRHAKYKELPNVRARRIKTIEADIRKQERSKAEAEKWLKLWSTENLTHEQALSLANHCWLHLPLKEGDKEGWTQNPTAYTALTGDFPNLYAPRTLAEVIEAAKSSYPKAITWAERWISHYENRLIYERAMLGEQGGTATDQVTPEKGGACRCWVNRGQWSYIVKVNKVSVSVDDNWGNGGGNFHRIVKFTDIRGMMSAAEVQEKREAGLINENAYKTAFLLLDSPTLTPKAPKEAKPEAAKFDTLKEQLKAGVQVVSAPQLFTTPRELAARMVEESDIKPGHRVLEPSAGTGNLLAAIGRTRTDCKAVAVEINNRLAENLKVQFLINVDVHCADFLECNGDLGKFDRVIMNPPFANQADIDHVTHALKFLKDGGKLVAIMSAGVTFRQDRKATKFREMVNRLGGSIEALSDNTFMESGTGVRAVLVSIG